MKFFILSIGLCISSYVGIGQTYFLNGSAVYLGNDCYQLTPALGTMNGTVWYAEQIDLNEPFDLQFLMNFGFLDANGADGMCFVLQTVGTNAIGASGGGMGYQTFGTSLGIEFDTYQNGNFGDPTYDHIAIEYNGNINHGASTGHIAGPVQASSTNVNIEDGEDHIVRVTWNPATHIVEVYFDCVFRLQGEIDLINTIFGGQNMVYWGFTAATGGSYNFQTVCLREDILNQTEVTICTGASTSLVAGESSNGVYTWTPTEYLDNPSIANPIATPPSDMTYTASYLDICNNPVQFEVTVHVEDLEVTVEDIQLISCSNAVNATAVTNFDINGTYTWILDGEIMASGVNLNPVGLTHAGTYTLQLNVQDQCFADTTFQALGSFAENTQSATICNGAAITLDITNPAGGSYSWTPSNYLDNPSSGSPVATPSETIEYTATNVDTCGHTVETNFHITVETIVLDAEGFGTLSCINPSSDVTISINMDLDGFYTWTQNGEFFISGNNLMEQLIDEPGTYTVSVNIQDQCFAEETFVVPANFTTYEIDAGANLILNCYNEVVTILAETNGGGNVIWFHDNSLLQNETSLDLTVSETGTYTVVTSHPQSGCPSEDSMVVTQDYTTPTVSGGQQDSLSCIRPSVSLQNVNINSANDYSISWTTVLGNILSGNATIGPAVNATGDYMITVTDLETGCTANTSVFVSETDDFRFDINDLVFPNIITPNNDDANRYWQPFAGSNPSFDVSNIFSLFDLKVFNRWGNEVFSSEQFNKKWDAKDLEVGTYFYILNYESHCAAGSKREKHGYIQVAR